MKREITIHFGAHKTGSSAIQQALSDLNTADWLLIKSTTSANESLQLQSAFRKRLSPLVLARRAEGKFMNPALIKRLYRDQIAGSAASQFLISGESVDSFDVASLSSLTSFFKELDLEVSLIGYLRPLASIVPSVFQQRLKASAEFVRSRESLSAMIRYCMPVYGPMVKRLMAAASASQRLRLLAFDPDSFSQRDVVSDFCGRLGIPVPTLKPTKINSSLSLLAVKVLWIASQHPNSHPAAAVQVRRKVVKQLAEEFAHMPGFQIDPEKIAVCVTEMGDSVGWIDPLLEKHRPFSLLDVSVRSKPVRKQAIFELEQLAVLSECERGELKQALIQRDLHIPGVCSDDVLVSQYWQAVADRVRRSKVGNQIM